MVTGGLASEPVVSPVPVPDPDSERGLEGTAENNDGGVDGLRGQEENEQQKRMYYGLHWRKELNWRALGFEFIQEGRDKEKGVVSEDGVAFYA
jgi:tRNA-specific adenosine deaminase 3